jgi:putative methyltransferase (TIGR04325 family)
MIKNFGATGAIAMEMRHIANEIAGLPGIRLLAKPLYRHRFCHPHENDEIVHYYGRYDTFAQAKAHAPPTLPTDFDTQAAGQLYRHFLDRLRVTDYPVLYWLSRLLAEPGCRVFDLGGHIGTSYYAYRPYLDYPVDMRWLVHDVPAVLAAGRAWAREHDPEHRLAFTGAPDEADGYDLLITSGTLQYLDYTLPDLLQRLRRPPLHVLVNRVPMHPLRGYFTLQNFGIAICPYRVPAVPDFIADMEAIGYAVIDHWQSHERSLRVPFEPDCAIDSYHGFYFKRR